MTNLEALKALYVALGGSAADVAALTDNAAVISQIAVIAATVATAASAKELPSVTNTDNGKVLTVVAGKWAKAALPE